MVFVRCLTLQDHMIKALYDFTIRGLSRYVTIVAGLVVIDTGSGDLMVLVCLVISQDHIIKG